MNDRRTAGKTMHQMIAEGWRFRFVRWDGHDEHTADIPIGEFLRVLGFVVAPPTAQAPSNAPKGEP